MDNRLKIANLLSKRNQLLDLVVKNSTIIQQCSDATDALTLCIRNKGKILFCGNGGSAADAQHLAAELTGRFYRDRPPVFAEALHVNTSYLTAVANDMSFDEVYARLIDAKGSKGDVLFALSTSGKSANIIKALARAKSLGLTTIGLTGISDGEMGQYSDILINVPTADTPQIQEVHIMLGHIICNLLEETLFPDGK